MADAMTNNIRSSAGNDTRSIRGEAWSTEVFVQTQWLWLILPASLLVGTLVLICMTSINSRQHNVAPWKSSILVTLLHGLSEEVGGHFSPDASPSELEAVAQKLSVKLARRDVDDKLVAA